MGKPFKHKTLHDIDYELSQSSDPEKIINRYYRDIRNFCIGELGYDADRAIGTANYYKFILEDYSERRSEIFDLFKSYMGVRDKCG